ncbi:MAG: hypothetical protein MUC28_03370 [Planctomycetes bacterium]|jgi:hypothetical protein|nr:hypothetical protein [Planctomycetota bacterium]
MYQQLQKAINLAKKTGDRLLVFDPKQEDLVYVVMSLTEYEKIVIGRSEVRNLTEDELLDKINRDIAIWKSEQDSGLGGGKTDKTGPIDLNRENYHEAYYPSAQESENSKPKITKNHWRIPPERKMAAEEIIEEDRQYLQDI